MIITKKVRLFDFLFPLDLIQSFVSCTCRQVELSALSINIRSIRSLRLGAFIDVHIVVVNINLLFNLGVRVMVHLLVDSVDWVVHIYIRLAALQLISFRSLSSKSRSYLSQSSGFSLISHENPNKLS